MQNYKNEIKTFLDKTDKYRDCLFKRGYLITDKEINNIDEFPFYGNWSKTQIDNYNLYIQNDQNLHFVSKDELTVAIIGHAYNPFTMNYEEDKLCSECIEAYNKSKENFFDKVSEFTGIHLVCLFNKKDGSIIAVQDACGMQSCFFGKAKDGMYITEYPQLVSDICGLLVDPFVEKLVNTKCYHIGNRHLPGNLSPFKELKRLGGNTYMLYSNEEFSVNRFYPVKSHSEYKPEEFESGIEKIYSIIHKGIECCTKKWDRKAISLSGGTDSKTTLSCANGLYENFKYFSFYSKPTELVDAQAAKKICENLGLEHTFYEIPMNNEEVEDFDILKKIISHNTNYIKDLADNEIRKYIYLYRLGAYDVELKSWASEVGRVFLERKYQIKMPKVLSPRHFSIFQTRYFMHPLLLRKSDKIYREFMKETGIEGPIYNFEHTDLFYWEVRMGAWGTSVTSSQNLFSHQITMPINNRKLLELFLSFPHEYRKLDKVHKDVMKRANKKVVDSGVEVKNLYFHSYRIWMEKLYYIYRTLFHNR